MSTEDDTREMGKTSGGGLLGVIRKRTAMYTGERSLSAVSHFLSGYRFAQGAGQALQFDLPPDFHEWVAYRLHFQESTTGYRRMILDRFPEESVALDRFFELLDEHGARQESVVATIKGHGPAVFKMEHGSRETKRQAKLAEQIRLVVYTEDPGFFLTHDDQTAEYPRRNLFCPSLSGLMKPYTPDADYVKVIDQDRYNRLLQEDEAFVLQIRQERARQK
jgi:hypothetical protein